jgi:hypothetical protein
VRVVVPFTRLDDRTRSLLDRHAPGWVGVELDPAQPGAYQSLMEAEWQRPGDLMVVEHDIGIHADVLPDFTDCPGLWCGNPYNIAGQLLVCLGCTRFRAELKTAVPDLFGLIDALPFDGLQPRDWRRMDVRIAGVLQSRGFGVHTHHRPVDHYHEY